MESCSRVLFLGVKVVMVPAGSAVSAIVGDCLCLVPPDTQEYLIPSFPVEKENTINIIMGTTFREGRAKVFSGTLEHFRTSLLLITSSFCYSVCVSLLH